MNVAIPGQARGAFEGCNEEVETICLGDLNDGFDLPENAKRAQGHCRPRALVSFVV